MKFSQKYITLILCLLFIGIISKGFAMYANNFHCKNKASQNSYQQLSAEKPVMDADNEDREDDTYDSDSFTLRFIVSTHFYNPAFSSFSLTPFQHSCDTSPKKLYLQNCIFLI